MSRTGPGAPSRTDSCTWTCRERAHGRSQPETVLGAFLRALGTADSAIPDSLEERAALYRSTLDGRRILVLLDNARDAAQVRPLLPGMEGCAALVTSRVRMVDLAGAHLVDLDVMSPEEALQLFTKIVGEERVASERESALDVVAACGFLPLAIRIAASRLAARRTWTVSVLAAKLADERRRLDELQAGDLAVKATFELGYGQLEPAQARAFRLLGLADGPDISLAAAAAALDLPVEETEDLLESLVDTSLLESAAPGRYRYHDLVRLYARACAERDEQPPGERAAAMSRMLDFYLATAAGVYAIERPGDRLVDHLEVTEYPGLRFTEGSTALDWLYNEASPLLACVRQSAGTDRLRRAVDLLWAAKDLTESGANSHQYETTARAMCEATRTAGDAHAEGRARTTFTNVLLVSGRIQQAAEQAQLAMELAASARDAMAMSWAANDRGLTLMHQEQYADGKPFFEQAIEGYATIGNRPLEALSLCNLSRAHLGMGNIAMAVEIAQRGLSAYLRDRPDPASRQRSLRPGHRPDEGRPSHRGPQPALRRPVRLRQPPAAALGGDDQLPDRRGAPGRPPPRAGGPARRTGPRAGLHRRRPDAGQRADAAGPGPHRAGAGGPRQGLLARGAQPLRTARRCRAGRRGTRAAHARHRGVNGMRLHRAVADVQHSFISARHSRTCHTVASGGRRSDQEPNG